MMTACGARAHYAYERASEATLNNDINNVG